jgi:hypothetical protein
MTSPIKDVEQIRQVDKRKVRALLYSHTGRIINETTEKEVQDSSCRGPGDALQL